ncbi:GyrI-like domain-containing protein [Kocuria flava]|uniref:GyrI-like domain-containing protein n=1 Tax=Kocuria flava TaxID=446860 RepID=UPI001FF20146|nr:GyrI-like domain-containing protein [Kocuria flava]MCJ8505767.1 GyrI-like domain-containing protein [Kocuria flava]
MTECAARHTAVVRGTVAMEELRRFFDEAFRELGRAVARGEVVPDGAALALYPAEPGRTVALEVGFPVVDPVVPSGNIVPGRLPAGRVVELEHHGGYDGLGSAWGLLRTWAGEQGVVLGAPLWEVYETQPYPEADPASMRTRLCWSVAD